MKTAEKKAWAWPGSRADGDHGSWVIPRDLKRPKQGKTTRLRGHTWARWGRQDGERLEENFCWGKKSLYDCPFRDRYHFHHQRRGNLTPACKVLPIDTCEHYTWYHRKLMPHPICLTQVLSTSENGRCELKTLQLTSRRSLDWHGRLYWDQIERQSNYRHVG